MFKHEDICPIAINHAFNLFDEKGSQLLNQIEIDNPNLDMRVKQDVKFLYGTLVEHYFNLFYDDSFDYLPVGGKEKYDGLLTINNQKIIIEVKTRIYGKTCTISKSELDYYLSCGLPVFIIWFDLIQDDPNNIYAVLKGVIDFNKITYHRSEYLNSDNKYDYFFYPENYV